MAEHGIDRLTSFAERAVFWRKGFEIDVDAAEKLFDTEVLSCDAASVTERANGDDRATVLFHLRNDFFDGATRRENVLHDNYIRALKQLVITTLEDKVITVFFSKDKTGWFGCDQMRRPGVRGADYTRQAPQNRNACYGRSGKHILLAIKQLSRDLATHAAQQLWVSDDQFLAQICCSVSTRGVDKVIILDEYAQLFAPLNLPGHDDKPPMA